MSRSAGEAKGGGIDDAVRSLEEPAEGWESYFAARRWYGDKGRKIAAVEPFAILDEAAWQILEVRYRDGLARHYQMPGGIAGSSAAMAAFLHRLAGGFSGLAVAAKGGAARFRPAALSGPQLASRIEELLDRGAPQVFGGEMSNTLIRVGDDLAVKVYRRLAAGPHPEIEALEHLTRRGFAHASRLYGAFGYAAAGAGGQEPEMALGLVVEFLPSTRDLWSIFTAACNSSGAPGRASDAELAGLCERLGAATAALHRALEGAPVDAAAAGRIDVESDLAVLETLRRRTRTSAQRPLDYLPDQVWSRRREIRALVAAPIAGRQRPIRTHGDFHLGQVVLSGQPGRLVVLDFEGEPALDLAARRAPQPAARDVAGMLRSFSYARLMSPVELGRDVIWEWRLRKAFLDSYWQSARGAASQPESRGDFDEAVRVFELQKALHELRYEISHRPDWVWVPLRGILELLVWAGGRS